MLKKAKTIDVNRNKLKPMTPSPRSDQSRKKGKIPAISIRGLDYESENEPN